ncbi:enoyl-CoA hydratase-related protein [Actinomycetospora endophytica]|uniref:Enoyl-CoA hydratase-related protein n=1 Tax=Actinomycetospora endophytica TaxID=2291215 RepID=A0ABS8P8P8_9PSEU|nr:enoyl-CoA hydratase-related protein [Actinomycetospora endophytica]MCD2194616.1 enoyl-CoA hydratase-related protein [Actinomycetospora endophytica]
MPTYETVRLHELAGARRIELHRPDSLNAWTPEMGRELLDALTTAAEDPEVRAILITGAGRAFSAGADVKNARELTADGAPDLSGRLRTIYNPIISTIRQAPKPVIVAIHGACAGLGVSLALAGDLLLAADDAYLLLAFARIGVMPDGGVLPALAERIGLTRAAELAMLADKLPAERAHEWGLVTAVHPRDELFDQAVALAERLAAGPTVAYSSIKTVLAAAAQPRLDELLTLEADLQQRHATTHDYAEGRAAFVEKRPVAFTGR